jgi:mono/diheme cytochrome c family protein
LPLVSLVALVACEMPTPLAPAEPIGTAPTWGEGFAQPAQPAGDSAMGMGQAPVDTAGKVSPGNTGEWSGGDVTLGKGIYTAMCARCHGASGEGGAVPGVGLATAFADPKWQAEKTDKQMARVIALGQGGMPSFMRELDKDKLAGVIAYIRTLKK